MSRTTLPKHAVKFSRSADNTVALTSLLCIGNSSKNNAKVQAKYKKENKCAARIRWDSMISSEKSFSHSLRNSTESGMSFSAVQDISIEAHSSRSAIRLVDLFIEMVEFLQLVNMCTAGCID